MTLVAGPPATQRVKGWVWMMVLPSGMRNAAPLLPQGVGYD